MAPSVYLVSGANRGVGLALVTELLARDDTVVFAGARNPSAAKDLHALEAKYTGKLHTVKLTSGDKADNDAAVAKIKEIAGHLDVVIANAGISNSFTHTADIPLEEVREHFEVNVLGTLALFQAAYPLLKSAESAKFVTISSQLGSIQHGPLVPWPTTAYGTSKAASNWLSRKVYFEYPGLITVAIHPGVVKTDMSAFAIANEPALANFPMITAEESATGILKVVDAAVLEKDGPKFRNWDGKVLPW
ncbi:NAD(P)-binding protein [Calocera viscosa TUFC12733]|uniref:NAD(P)-binding protein n=1 Tax=Calocera viscosa (strain TUFC12733) TaxID=1330018 RepID=A0A167I7L4_CALVF|nr:NAD(P)-binding protein [Calocera viscosa TUFC12733]